VKKFGFGMAVLLKFKTFSYDISHTACITEVFWKVYLLPWIPVKAS